MVRTELVEVERVLSEALRVVRRVLLATELEGVDLAGGGGRPTPSQRKRARVQRLAARLAAMVRREPLAYNLTRARAALKCSGADWPHVLAEAKRLGVVEDWTSGRGCRLMMGGDDA